jgi:phosphate transport system substrate-binding protein
LDLTIGKRLSALALLSAVAINACTGGGSTPTASQAAATTRAATSAAPAATTPAATSPVAATPGASSPAATTPGTTMQPPAPATANVTLQGAGATFPDPLYETWFQEYTGRYPNIQFNYQSIGSGGGIKAITEQTVDFGASDAPLKDEEVAALPAGTKLLHVPTALGAVVVIFNLPGVTELKLDSANVADIYLGNIKKWNDPKIAANNAGVTLPDTDVLVVHRSDGSGTTNAFTTYLDTVSPDWHTKVGKGKEVNWPTGTGASGNDGVAGGVKNTPGAVGYVELNYATQAKLTSAKLKNADGAFVAGSTAGVTAAAEAAAATFPADFRQAPIINGTGPDTYPIASYTYILMYADQKDADKGKSTIAFLAWALMDGQAEEEALGYAPLPNSVDEKALAELRTVTTGGTPIWP